MKLPNFLSRKSQNTPLSIREQMENWSDEECLYNFLQFTPRVGVGTQFVQNEVGFITHQILEIQCGDKVFMSNPRELDWPLEPVAFPADQQKKLN